MRNMTEHANKFREFELRTTEFAKRMIRLCKTLQSDSINRVLISQAVRSAGSVGANYREANETVGRKDFLYRLRIARKECKETEHWLMLIMEANPDCVTEVDSMQNECREIRSILSAMILKSQENMS